MGSDWDFKFEDDEEATGEITSTRSKPQGKKLKKRIKQEGDSLDFEKPVKIRLDYKSVKKRRTRSQYVEKVEEEEDDEKFALPEERLMAIALDYGLAGMGYFFADGILNKVMLFVDIPEKYSNLIVTYSQYIVPVIIFIILNLLFPLILHKTVGMLVFKQSVLTKDFELVSVFKLWIRELIFKPLGIISVIGLLMIFTKENRTLWDRILGTVVVSDRVD